MSNLLEILEHHGIKGKIVSTTEGPLLNIIEFLPDFGTRIKTIKSLTEDIRRELCVKSLKIEQPEFSNKISFQIAKDTFDIIDFSENIKSKEFEKAKEDYTLPILIGADIYGIPLFQDLSKMPHLLVAGTTGSGKSVGLNTFILSLIASKTPNEVKFVLIDPKKVEFSVYNNQKYQYCPVITETNEAVSILSHLAEIMDERYELFNKHQVKNINYYNQISPQKLPYIICVIDEFADLMAFEKSIDENVIRLAQKSRAAGIHLILATQRPSADVITGLLKANCPARISYKVASALYSRIILNENGGEDLIGRGDSYFLRADGKIIRVHGAYIDDSGIKSMLEPYRCTIKHKITIADKKDSVSETTKEKPSALLRFAKFWLKLSRKDRDLIIRAIKYIFTFIVNYIKDNKKLKRTKK
ncbi:MAG: DNA translocase FtsK [Alphaproteobacteria bacterium]|nr:DNA translocase FtsK [Alphaproteobacteria bacterium]